MPETTSSDPASKLENIKKTVHKFLHEENSFTYLFGLAEKYTKISREYIFLGEFRRVVILTIYRHQ